MKVKCTFKEKNVEHFGRCTKVTLTCSLPYVRNVTSSVYEWVYTHPQVDQIEDTCPRLVFKVSGISIRNPEDADDPTIGTRIAESRAKRKAYRFCETFCGMAARDFEKKFEMFKDASGKFAHHHAKETSHYNEIMGMQ